MITLRQRLRRTQRTAKGNLRMKFSSFSFDKKLNAKGDVGRTLPCLCLYHNYLKYTKIDIL